VDTGPTNPIAPDIRMHGVRIGRSAYFMYCRYIHTVHTYLPYLHTYVALSLSLCLGCGDSRATLPHRVSVYLCLHCFRAFSPLLWLAAGERPGCQQVWGWSPPRGSSRLTTTMCDHPSSSSSSSAYIHTLPRFVIAGLLFATEVLGFL